jgi:hypothetical protein
MLYPQWSKGNELKGQIKDSQDSYKFLQPFSQTITSSPLIRLRVGDLIASNYSRFNLARNFGAGLVDTYIKEPSTSPFKSSTSNIDLLERFISNLHESSFTIDSPIEPMLLNPEPNRPSQFTTIGEGIEVVFASTVTIEQGTGFIKPSAGLRATATIKKGTKGKVLKGRKRSDGTVTVVVKLDPGEEIKVNTLVSKITGKKPDDDGPRATKIEYVAVNPEVLYCVQSPGSQQSPSRSSQQIQQDIDDTNEQITRNNERVVEHFQNSSEVTDEIRALDDETEVLRSRREVLELQRDAARLSENIDQQQKELINDNFLNANEYLLGDKGNSIVRSFEDSGGRGLAGSIRSLSFDWNEAPWETSVGSRAPMWCKVSLQFNPIHDLPMGLDHEGMPRTVPYPVGETVRQAYFPELNEQSKKERVSQIADTTKFWDAVGDKAEEEINGYFGKSLKRLF